MTVSESPQHLRTMCFGVLIYLLSCSSAVSSLPISDPNSELASLIRKGELAKAALYLDRQLESTADKQERAELASSRLILHHFTQDFKGYYKTLETHLPILQEDIRTSQGARKYYLNSLLLGGLTYGSSLYPTREVANDSFLRFERERNEGFDIPSLGFYTTTIKSSVAWRFGELDFSYDLLYRAGALLATKISDPH